MAAKTLSLSHRLKQMIQVCQRKMERKITHVTLRDRVRCEDLGKSTGMRDASNLAERLKWKWSGHVARMDNKRWTNKLTMLDPREGRRNVGRQRTRWADQLKRLAGDQWSRSAKDRVLWKELEKTLVCRTSSPIEHTRAMPCSRSRRPCPFRDVWLN